ncbi:MAG: uroporphyrinogen decarboxylase family protein [Candidatus Lokiarchaeota archaeon]
MSMLNLELEENMNALERILAVVTGKIPDRVPIFPMIDSLPASLFNMSIKDYFSGAENLVAGQNKLQELFNLDYVSNFFYLAIETELFGMNTLFFEKGSPNTGEPVAKSLDFFQNTEIPNLYESTVYQKTIKSTKRLSDRFKGEKPILSVQTGPFSFPSLLMGSSRWFESILLNPEEISNVLDFAINFAVKWANGHLEAGADVIVLVDGLATATSIPRDMFEDLIIPIYSKLKEKIDAPIVFYTAGGNILPFADLFPDLGVIGVFPSANDDLNEFKKKSEGNYTLFGNINNLEFGDWTPDFMEKVVKTTMDIGKPNGRFVLATQHMIPHGTSIESLARFLKLALKYSYY